MSVSQADLFSSPARTGDVPGDDIVSLVRAQHRQTLALVRSVQSMPWTDLLEIIQVDTCLCVGEFAEGSVGREVEAG